MRDLKHIGKRGGIFGAASSVRRRKETANAFRHLIEPRPVKRRLRIVLPILAGILAAYPLVSQLVSARQTPLGKSKKAQPLGQLNDGQAMSISVDALGASRLEQDRLLAPLPDGGRITYSLDNALQERVQEVFRQYQVPYGVLVAIEPKSGRVLAMTGFSAVDPSWTRRAWGEIFPMASLFKMVTASAALERKQISPDTVVAFRGRLASENPRYWEVRPGQRGQRMDVTTAMGKSVNPVFGRLAGDVVGRDAIIATADRFGFNQPLFKNAPLSQSTTAFPEDDRALKLMGAGLNREVRISPLHAAAIMAAIANNGTMMLPHLADEIVNGQGTIIYRPQAQQLRQVVSPGSAAQLTRMLSATVKKGTSRKAFHDRRGRPKLADIAIAAKTGSIDGKQPAGHYSWFAAFAPENDPQIALVALVINGNKWRIKAPQVGEQALEAFFR